jgi:bifunctional non-homologous end joining protein LigD
VGRVGEVGGVGRVRPIAGAADPPDPSDVSSLLRQIDEIEGHKGNGTLHLPDGDRLEVGNLGKIFWPALKLTKGDLLRHYVRVAPVILPVLADRPLVMKRFPNGVDDAGTFYQHRAPDRFPPGVRVAIVSTESETRSRIIGGNLKTLLYTAQLASISQDPWFSRLGSAHAIDYVAIDLDPPDDLPFSSVLDVARWVRDELDAIGVPGFPKTSGAAGLHVFIPMPPDAPYEAGRLFCQIISTVVAQKHPRLATVDRAVRQRGRRVYVDFLQNRLGSTLASAYSARANHFAGVSTPLTWAEVDEGVSPTDFTVRTFPARLQRVGDLWAGLRNAKGADLTAAMRYGRGGRGLGTEGLGTKGLRD